MKVSVSPVKDFGVGEMAKVLVTVGVLCRVGIGSTNREKPGAERQIKERAPPNEAKVTVTWRSDSHLNRHRRPNLAPQAVC